MTPKGLKWIKTPIIGRALGRFVPYVGWVLLTNDVCDAIETFAENTPPEGSTCISPSATFGPRVSPVGVVTGASTPYIPVRPSGLPLTIDLTKTP